VARICREHYLRAPLFEIFRREPGNFARWEPVRDRILYDAHPFFMLAVPKIQSSPPWTESPCGLGQRGRPVRILQPIWQLRRKVRLSPIRNGKTPGRIVHISPLTKIGEGER